MAADGYVAAARAAGRRGATSPDRIATALAAYETLKRRRGVVDLDDLLTIAARELLSDPAWADAVRFRYRHVVVDEAQDLNPVQHRMLDLIVGGRDDLYLVGDPAQAIYGFNGSDPGLLRDIAARLPGVEVIHLPTNHRSTPQVVAAGAAVLQAGGQPAVAVAVRGDGEALRILAADDEDHEAALVATFGRAVDPVAVRAGTMAVLARTNAQLRAAGLGAHRRRRAGDATPAGPGIAARRGRTRGDGAAIGVAPARLGARRARGRRGSRRSRRGRRAPDRRSGARVPARATVRRRSGTAGLDHVDATRSPTASAVSRSSRSTPPREGSGRSSW